MIVVDAHLWYKIKSPGFAGTLDIFVLSFSCLCKAILPQVPQGLIKVKPKIKSLVAVHGLK